MQKTLMSLAFATLAAAPAMAATGDAEAGAKVFNQCQTCHVIANEAGEVLAGKASKTGPNLYGLPGRTAGTQPDFAGYGESLVALGASGFTWNEEDFVAYAQNPGKFLKDKLGDTKARSKMSFQLRKEEDARNVWAFIASLSPAAAEGAATEAAPAEGEAAPSN